MTAAERFDSFVRVAHEYCACVESMRSGRDVADTQLAGLLAALITHGLALPEVEPTDADLPEGPTASEWRDVFGGVRAGLRHEDTYWTVYEPTGRKSQKPVAGSLADDLTDVWRDMSQGLRALEAGSAWKDVAWEWRFGLDTHWGKHAAEALRVLLSS